MGKTLIIGAGITGLSVAWHLEGPYLVLERARKPGGLCASEKINGCTFDYSGHFLHFHHPETRSLVENVLLKGNLDAVDRSTWIHTHGCWVPFPFQANLHALPPAIREECVRGARKRPALAKKKFTSLEEWSLSVFGAGITKYFMKPYNEKLWSFPAAKLNSDWTAPFVPKPPLKEILEGAESASGRRYGYNARFYYPRSGGAQALIDALAARVSAKGRLSLGAEVRSVDLDRKTVTTLAGETHEYGSLVSTMPLSELARVSEGLPPAARKAAAKLKWNSVHCLNIAFREKDAGPALRGKHWAYFPERKFNFYRAGAYSNISRSAAPEGYCSMYVEISTPGGAGFDAARGLASAKEGLAAAGFTRAGAALEAAEWFEMPFGYVIYDRDRAEAAAALLKFFRSRGVHPAGRYGAWKYSFMEESMWEGKLLADKLNGKN